MTNQELPYTGGTEKAMRERISRHAYAAQQRFGEFIDLMMTRRGQSPGLTDDEFREQMLAHHASLYGWATISLLGFIRDRLGEEALFSAACMVDDMGTNGGAPYTEDLPYPPVDTKVVAQ